MRSQPRPVPTVRWAVLALVTQLACVLMLALSGPAWAKPEFPALTGRVVDQANILPPETEQQLELRLAALEASTPDKDQLVVVTVADLGGYEIADYGYQLGRHWAIGQKDKDNGVLLIVAPNDRKVRVEVGYGLEPVITDAVSSLIIQNKIVPKFKAGDLPGGVVDGTEALIETLAMDRGVAIENAKALEAQGGPGKPIPLWVIILVILFFIVFGRGWFPFLLGMALSNNSDWDGGSSGGFGSGGGFGGGFGGGGGGFGGGGASGSW